MRSARRLGARGFETEVFDYVFPDSFQKQYSDEDALMGDVIDSEAVESEGCRERAFYSHRAIKNMYEILTTPLTGAFDFNHNPSAEGDYSSWD